jgi:hypothetical protein
VRGRRGSGGALEGVVVGLVCLQQCCLVAVLLLGVGLLGSNDAVGGRRFTIGAPRTAGSAAGSKVALGVCGHILRADDVIPES